MNAKLTGTNEALSLQLGQKEDDLAKRRVELATLHRACAKYKQARAMASIKQALPTTTDSVCSHCQKVFGEMKETLNAQFDERLKTALKEKDGEIERLAAAMADKESKKINKRKS